MLALSLTLTFIAFVVVPIASAAQDWQDDHI